MIRDDKFLSGQPAPQLARPPRLSATERGALEGIGDRRYRAVADHFASISAPGEAFETANGRFAQGDQVVFTEVTSAMACCP